MSGYIFQGRYWTSRVKVSSLFSSDGILIGHQKQQSFVGELLVARERDCLRAKVWLYVVLYSASQRGHRRIGAKCKELSEQSKIVMARLESFAELLSTEV